MHGMKSPFQKWWTPRQTFIKVVFGDILRQARPLNSREMYKTGTSSGFGL